MTPTLLVLSILPAMLVFVYFYSRDIYPEPRHTIVKTFLLGCIVPIGFVFLLVYPDGFVNSGADPVTAGLQRAFLNAALPEEFGKFLVLWLYCSRQSEFDEPMDGLVYGVTASLGFAMVENILYVAQGGLSVGIARAITSVPGHAMFGVIMGYYFSLAHFDPQKKLSYYIKALTAPVLFHGFYNFPLMAVSTARELSPLLLIYLCVFPGGILLAIRLARKTRKLQIDFHPELLHQAFLVRTPLSKAWRLWVSISFGAVIVVFSGIIALSTVLQFFSEDAGRVALVVILIIACLFVEVGRRLYRRGMDQLNELDRKLNLDMQGIKIQI